MALVFVLWIMVILCAAALEVQFASHLKLRVTANIGGATKALFLARAGVERAIADVAENRDEVQALADLREGDDREYQNIPLGEGAYTLYAGMDPEGEPQYGLIDEAAKINVNTAAREVLAKIPGLDSDLATEIEQLRKESKEIRDLDMLSTLEALDPITLYGEDQNHNGLLDANEDDGDESWPPDNADGYLDGGASAFLTLWSAAKNVSADGTTRININEASAEELKNGVSDLSSEQVDSIIAHRDKSKFASVFELLDVELVERVPEGQQGEPSQESQPPEGAPPPGEAQNGNEAKPADEEAEGEQEKAPEEEAKPAGEEPKGEGESEEAKDEAKKPDDQGKQEKPATRGTGKKAFDEDTVRRLADRFTITKEKVLQGGVNINTATAEVLACLPGIDESLAQAILRERQGREKGFQTIADLLDVEGISADVLKKIEAAITVRSDVFSVRSFGVLPPGDQYCCAFAVIDRTKDKIQLNYWRELE